MVITLGHMDTAQKAEVVVEKYLIKFLNDWAVYPVVYLEAPPKALTTRNHQVRSAATHNTPGELTGLGQHIHGQVCALLCRCVCARVGLFVCRDYGLKSDCSLWTNEVFQKARSREVPVRCVCYMVRGRQNRLI